MIFNSILHKATGAAVLIMASWPSGAMAETIACIDPENSGAQSQRSAPNLPLPDPNLPLPEGTSIVNGGPYVEGGILFPGRPLLSLNTTVCGPSASSLAIGSVAMGHNAAVTVGANRSVAIGANASATAANSVALGGGSVADQANTLAVGAVGAERRIVNVAAGIAATDAVNMGQLDAEVTTRQQQMLQVNQRITLEESARTALGVQVVNETNSRIAADLTLSSRIDAMSTGLEQIGSRLSILDQRIASSTAVATAMGGAVFLPDMKFNLTANVATYDGAHAGAMQIGALISKSVALNAGVATGFNKKGKTAARVGVTFGW